MCAVEDKEMLVADAGKLSILDRLLTRLKAKDHRVLIYSQMTRMIDILEVWFSAHFVLFSYIFYLCCIPEYFLKLIFNVAMISYEDLCRLCINFDKR